METEVYTLSKGGFKKLSEHPELPKGTIIYAFGAGMEESRWATTGKGDEIVKLSPNYSESYFSNPYNTLDEYCRPISDKFGIGFYYDLDAPRATDEEIAQAIERANNFIKERERTNRGQQDQRGQRKGQKDKRTKEEQTQMQKDKNGGKHATSL